MTQERKLTMTKKNAISNRDKNLKSWHKHIIKKCGGKKSSKFDHYRTKMVISMVIRFRRPYRQRFDGSVNCRNARFLPSK